MNGISPPSAPARSPARKALPLEAIAQRWEAAHQAVEVVARLACRPSTALPAGIEDFPAAVQAAGGWRLTLAEQGIADLVAVMEAGLAGLLAIHHRGADPRVAAETLWVEFQAARSALVALAPPSATLPERPA